MTKNKKKKSGDLTTWIIVLLMIAGLSLLLYPTFADWWNNFHASRAIAGYSESVSQLDTADLEKMWDEAVKYNTEEFQPNATLSNISDDQKARYKELLDITGTGIMGYLEIPKIRVQLPIYHGTEDTVLQIAIGHLENTTLPVGGPSTHVVVSGHRGLPSAKLLTDLDKVVEGDTFMFQVLGRTLTYEVDQIRVVLPTELHNLVIEENMDYATLVTCTPYGINSHRLLVRGHRIEGENPDAPYVAADATQVEQMYIALFIAVPILFILLIYILVKHRKKK